MKLVDGNHKNHEFVEDIETWGIKVENKPVTMEGQPDFAGTSFSFLLRTSPRMTLAKTPWSLPK